MYALEPTSYNNTDARAAILRELETLQEISSAVESAKLKLSARLGSYHNRFSKINHLPVEILREILLYVCEDGHRWKHLVDVLMTCKLWHNILSNDPIAYSTINLGGSGCYPGLADIYSQRNARVPLHIAWEDIGAGTVTEPWKIQFCMEHISRIRTMVVRDTDRYDTLWFLDTPAPLLERCELSLLYQDSDRSALWTHWEDRILPRLFGGSTPRLRSLVLRGHRLAWCPGNYSNLTRLSMSFHRALFKRGAADDGYLPMIFQESPNLIHLELDTDSSEVERHRSREEVPIRHRGQPQYVLHRLRSLRLRLSLPYIIYILRIIVITPLIETYCIHPVACFSRDECLAALDKTILPDFLFSNLKSFSVDYQPHVQISGSGLSTHKYSFSISLPITAGRRVIDRVTSERVMPNLTRLGLHTRAQDILVPLLARYTTITDVEITTVEPKVTAEGLSALASISDNHVLSGVRHWVFKDEDGEPVLLDREGMNSFKTFFQLPSPSLRTIAFCSSLVILGHTFRAREFVLDLAQLSVAISGPITTSFYYDYSDQEFVYKSVEELWHEGAPQEVQAVMSNFRGASG